MARVRIRSIHASPGGSTMRMVEAKWYKSSVGYYSIRCLDNEVLHLAGIILISLKIMGELTCTSMTFRQTCLVRQVNRASQTRTISAKEKSLTFFSLNLSLLATI